MRRRPSWPAGILHWLGSGGAFRPTRSVQPVPWIYLASGLLGAAVAAVPVRRRRRPATMVGGAAGGALLCWAGYASTARTTPGLADELLTAGLQEVSPDRAAARRRARDAALAQTASFAVYAPVAGTRTAVWREGGWVCPGRAHRSW